VDVREVLPQAPPAWMKYVVDAGPEQAE